MDAQNAARQLRQELRERRYEGPERFVLTPRVYWNRDVRRMGCGASNALDTRPFSLCFGQESMERIGQR